MTDIAEVIGWKFNHAAIEKRRADIKKKYPKPE